MTNIYTPLFEPNTFNLFKTEKFREFLVKNNVSVTVVGFVVANHMLKLIDSFYNDIIFVCNEENMKEKPTDCRSILDHIYYFKLTFFYYNIYIGKFIISIFKFICSCMIAFYLARFLNDLIN